MSAAEGSESSNEWSGSGDSSPIPMNGDVPSPGGGESSSSSSSSSLSVLDNFRRRFHLDTVARQMSGNSSPEESRFEASDDDFPPHSFDFDGAWEEINSELNQEEEEYSDFFSECAANNREAAAQLKIAVSEEAGLKELEKIDAQLVYPPESEMKTIVGKLRPRVEDDNSSEGAPACKRLRRASGQKITERASSSSRSRNPSESNEKQFAFVVDKVTKERKLIHLRKGEQLPDGLELASINSLQGKFSTVSDELSSLNLEKVKGAISSSLKQISTGNSSQSSSLSPPSASGPEQSGVPNGKESSPSIAAEAPEEQVSQTSNGRKSKRLACLSDLMTQEIKKKSETPTASTPVRLGCKLSPIKRTVATRASGGLTTPDLDIIHLGSDKADARNQKYLNPNPNSFKISTASANRPTNSPKSMAKVPAQPKIISSSLSQAQQTKSQNVAGPIIVSTQSLSLTRPTKSDQPPAKNGTKINPLLQCEFCPERFLCYEDDLFRKHVFFKHEFEIKEYKQFDDRRIFTNKLRECNKCRTYVVQTEDHQRTCGDQSTFDLVVVVQSKLLRHVCGICGKGFSARYELHRHITDVHVNFMPKIILNPLFRCAQCLRRFESAFELTKHSVSCMELHPRLETIQELAKLYLHCDICSGTHSTLDETSNCYFRKDILRCAICFDIYKEKPSFLKHLHNHHGLQLHPTVSLPCPFCPNVNRGKYQDIFPHIVGDHFGKVINSVNSIVPSYALALPKQMNGQYQQDPSGPRVKSVVGNFNQSPQSRKMPDLKPVPRMVAVQPSPTVRINTNRINPTFGPGTVATTSGKLPSLVMGPNSNYIDVNGRKFLYLGGTAPGGTQTIQLPFIKNTMALGNSLQGGLKLVRTTTRSASGATTGPIRFAVSSAANPLLRAIGPGSSSAKLPVSSTSTSSPPFSKVRYSSAPATTTTQSSSAAPKVPMSKSAPKTPNQAPVTVKRATADGTSPAPSNRLMQLINTARQAQGAPIPIPNLPPGISVHQVSGTSSSSSNSSSTCSSPSNVSMSKATALTVTVTPAAAATSQPPTSSSKI